MTKKNNIGMTLLDITSLISNIFSILLSIIAIYGTIKAITSGFIKELHTVIHKTHIEIQAGEHKLTDLEKQLKDYLETGKY